MKAREVLDRLHKDGWIEKEQKSSHLQLVHPVKAGKVTVPMPMHKGDLPKGTVHSILKQAGLKWDGEEHRQHKWVHRTMERLQLIVEKGDDEQLSGRVNYEDNLLVDAAGTLNELQENMAELIADFHDASTVTFDLAYDLSAFFAHYSFLKISRIAEYAGVNAGLLRHYSAGSKHPSAEQVKRIEEAVHRLAAELSAVHLVTV